MQPTFLRLEQEPRAVLAEADLTRAAALRHTERRAQAGYDEIDRWTALSAIGSGIEKTYSGIDRALTIVAAQIDGEVPRDPFWRRTLLDQMASSLPEVRPAILSPDTAAVLDRLRGFRHRERQLYGGELMEDRLLELVADSTAGAAAFCDDLARFVEAMSTG